MIVTYKEKTMRACKELIYKYEHPTGKEFFSIPECPLCNMYYSRKGEDPRCIGCLLANKTAGRNAKTFAHGCEEFSTYILARGKLASMNVGFHDILYKSEMLKEEFSNRASFFKMIIPILEKIPAKRFTPSGWIYFKELDRKWLPSYTRSNDMNKYKYTKGLFDIINPAIIKGSEIKDGSTVKIVKNNFDPLNKFVYIEDENGNTISTPKSSLTKIESKEHNELQNMGI